MQQLDRNLKWMTKLRNKLVQLYDKVLDNDLSIDGDTIKNNEDHFSAICRSTESDSYFRYSNDSFYMYSDATDEAYMYILVVLSDIINTSNKELSERILELLTLLESMFIKLNYTNSYKDNGSNIVYLVVKIMGERMTVCLKDFVN